LRSELEGMDMEKAAQKLHKMDIADLITGMSTNPKNTKDMASYRFWQTQPVQRFDEKPPAEDGPIKVIDIERVPKQPEPLIDGFEWATLDLEDEKQLHELYELLRDHYVEDTSAMFRFNYSISFLNWLVDRLELRLLVSANIHHC
jgi:glycylpeptide N-tetradecanoyltransferase